MSILLPYTANLDELNAQLDTMPRLNPDEIYGEWATEQAARDAGDAAERDRAAHNKKLEEYDASFLASSWGSFRFNTGIGALTENIIDRFAAGPEDVDFDIEDHIESANKALPGMGNIEYDYLKKAKNKKHYEMLLENLTDKKEFMFNNEALGVPLSIAAGLFAELGNPVNYVPILQFSGLGKIKSIKGALAAGQVQGVVNVAEEAAIHAHYGDRNTTDYLMAYTFGASLGTGTALLSKSKTKAEMLSTRESLEQLDRRVNMHVKDASDEALDLKENGPPPAREYAEPTEKDVNAAMKRNPGDEEFYETVVLLDKDGNMIDDAEPTMSTETRVHVAADQAELDGRILQEDKLPQSRVGLASMAQSLLESKNKLTRYISNALFEHGEKSGFKETTAALQAQMDVDRIFGPYAKRKVELNAAWAKEAEEVGLKHTDFNEAAIKFIDGNDQFFPNSTPKMNEIMAEFVEEYKKTNGEINRVARESGVEEFSGKEDLDDMHLYRSYDLEQFHKLTTKYNDGGKAIKATLKEAINRGNYAAMARKFMKEGDVVDDARIDREITKMAEAVYNRMLKRATVNTADANLLSSGNMRLLKDVIADASMDAADKKHINYVIDSAGRDLKANPMAQQIKMDLSTKVGDVGMSDLLHTNLDSNFLQKGRYWIGRSAMAKKGEQFASERAIWESIDAADKYSTKSGQTREQIIADKDRMTAGIRMILGQPIDPAEMVGEWRTAMRAIRKLTAASGLGKLGIVQYGEGGRAIAAKGVSQAMLIPEIAKLTKSIITGKLSDISIIKEIEDFAVGDLDSRLYMNHPDFRADDFGMKISEPEKMLDKMSFFMSKASGWNRVHRMQTAYVMDGLSQKWYRDIMTDTFKKTQMDDLGITGLDLKALKREMKKHVDETEGLSANSKVKRLNLSEWDPDVRNKFALMLTRKSKNAVQDIMAGETPMWMNTVIGKFLGQFRSFSVAALSKQTTRDYKMLKQGDMEGAVMLEFMFATSALATLAKTYYTSLGVAEKDRKKWLQEQMALPQFTTNVMSYVGSISALADIGTTASTNLFGVDLAGQRQYRADGIAGLVPGVQYVDRVRKTAAGIASAPFTGYNRSAARAATSILPGNTLWGLDVITKTGLQQLPE